MQSRSFSDIFKAHEFYDRVNIAGGDAEIRPIEANHRHTGYEVLYCDHTPQWVINDLPSPLDFLLNLLSDCAMSDKPVRIQYLRAQMRDYGRDSVSAAIEEGLNLRLIMFYGGYEPRLFVDLTPLAFWLEAVAAQEQPATA